MNLESTQIGNSMRYLQMCIPSELVFTQEVISEYGILTFQYLEDGTMLELGSFETDAENPGVDLNNDLDNFEYNEISYDQDVHYFIRHFHPQEQQDIYQLLLILSTHHLLILSPMYFDQETGGTLSIIGSTHNIQRAFSNLPEDIGRQIEINHLTGQFANIGGTRSKLTSRQREVLETAINMGYYSIPRRSTAGDISDVVGCAASTTSEHLRKIESHIIRDLNSTPR